MRHFCRFFLVVSLYISSYNGYAQCPTLPDTLVVCPSNPIDTPYAIIPQPQGVATSYLWSTGATASSISVSNKGRYWVKMALAPGDTCTDTITVGVWGEGNKGDYQWYFGNQTGLNFLSGTTPSLISGSSLNAIAGTSVISDPTGHILFYTDGKTIYSSNNQPMTGGTNLPGDNNLTQSSVIIPSQKENNIYTVYTVSATGLQYDTVDLSMNNGLGAVTSSTSLNDINSNEVAAVYDTLGNFWVTTDSVTPSGNSFLLAYHVTNNGVNPTPVISPGGPNPGEDLKFSSNGNEAAQAIPGSSEVVIYNFNKTTGVFTGKDTIHVNSPNAVEFSPDGTKLYVTTGAPGNGGGHLYQYDLTQGNSTLINKSRYLVTKDSTIGYYGIEAAPNGQIYIATGNGYLASIASPNSDSSGLNYNSQAVSLNGSTSIGLPNFVANYFTSSSSNIEFSGNCSGSQTIFVGLAIDSANTWTWNFGDISAPYTYTAPAPYGYSDTVTHSYAPGSYKVSLQLEVISSRIVGGSCIDTSSGTIVIYQTPTPGSINAAFCNTTTADTLDAGTYYAGSSTLGSFPIIYSWTNGANIPVWSAQKLGTDTSGIYNLIVDNNGCAATASDTITFINLPSNFLGNDTTLCTGQTDVIGAPALAGVSTTWNMGTPFSNNDSVSVTSSVAGSYKYIATLTTSAKPSCSVKDSVKVTFVQVPVVSFGPNLTLCDGTTQTLDAKNPGYNYLWSTGSTSETLKVTSAGTYYVTVYLGSCGASDTIIIGYEAYPTLTLPSEVTYCSREQSSVNLYGGVNNATTSYAWSNGQITDSIQVDTSGVYTLQAYSAIAKCKSTASVTVNDICTPQLFVPAAFSPNNDGKNDVFQIFGNHILTYEIRIFDKWGELIFVSNDRNVSWDGSYKGQTVQQGVYTWKIVYTGQTLSGTVSKVQEGNVTLIE